MDKNNIHELLTLLKFKQEGNIYTKRYSDAFSPLKVNIEGDGHIYYRECGITVGRKRHPICLKRKIWLYYSALIDFYRKAIIQYI